MGSIITGSKADHEKGGWSPFVTFSNVLTQHYTKDTKR